MARLKAQANLSGVTFASARSALVSVFDDIAEGRPLSAPTIDIPTHCVLSHSKRMVRLTGEVQQVAGQVTATLSYRALAFDLGTGAGCLTAIGLVLWGLITPLLFAAAFGPLLGLFAIVALVLFWVGTGGVQTLGITLFAIIFGFFFLRRA